MKRPGTLGLLVVISLIFMFEVGGGALSDKALLLRMGANCPELIAQGQWWRLFTASLLHLSYLHFFMNAISLESLGFFLEPLLGTSRFLLIALTAGLGGNLASAWVGHQLFSGGLSGMLFGLLGAVGFVSIRQRGGPPQEDRGREELPSVRRVSVLLILNLAISLLPMVDGWAHLGGFLAGLLVTPLVYWHRPLTLSLILAYTVAVGAAVQHASLAISPKEEYLSVVFEGDRMSDGVVNNCLWEAAIDPATSRDILERAEKAMRTRLHGEATHLDTHAYLLHRLGHPDEALAEERLAAWKSPTAHKFTQIYRMLGQTSAKATLQREGDRWVVHADVPGAAIYAQVGQGVLRLVLPAGARDGSATAPGQGTVRVMLVDGSPGRAEKATAQTQATYLPLEPVTLQLPWP